MENISTLLTIAAVGTLAVSGIIIKNTLNNKNNAITFDMFLKKASDKIDSFIYDSSKREKINYYGGKCKISISEHETKKIKVENKIFGKDDSGKWKESYLSYYVPITKFSTDSDTQFN